MVIRPITRQALNQLAPLLRAAFGSDFDLADELEYLPSPTPNDWVYLEDTTGTPRGYLRHFPVTHVLHVADVYVPRSPQRSHDLELLLQNLRHHTSLAAGVDLRFDVNVADTDLLNVLTATGTVKHTKDFLFFECDVPKQTSSVPTAGTFRPRPQTTLSAAREVLARLKLYTPETLVDLLAAERLFLWEHEGQVASALHLEPVSNEGCQIIALATAPTLEGRGYAHALLSTVMAYCTGRYTRIELQVNAENTSAVRLYRKAGFVEVPSKAERWLYTTWS